MTVLKMVLTMNFYGSLMGLVALGVSLLLNKVRAPRSVAMVLWGLVALRLLCPVELTSRFSVMNAVPQTRVTVVSDMQKENTPVPPEQTAENPAASDALTGNPTPLARPQTAPAARPEARPMAEPASSSTVLTVVWTVGAWGFALWGVISYVLLRRRLRFAMRMEPDVYEVDTISTPCVVGFLRPQVYLPVDLTQEQVIHTMTHERCHIRRGDHLWKLASYMVLTVHWFNPLVWVFYFRFQQDMEMACDERVMKLLGERARADYSQSLLALAKKQRAVTPTPVAFSENTTKARITGVLRHKKPLTTVTALVLAMGVVLAGCVAAGPAKDAPSEETTVPTEPVEITEPETLECLESHPEPVVLDGLVGVHRQEHLLYVEEYNQEANDLFLAVPEILLDSEDAKACNQALWNICDPVLDENMRYAREKGFISNRDINYDAWVYENTLTVCAWISTEYEYTDYYVYTLDLDTGKLLSNAETAPLAGLGEDWEDTLRNAVQRRFELRAGLVAQDEPYNAQLENTLSQENLSAAVIYPGADGTPMAAIRFYNLAGGAYSNELLNLREIFQQKEVDAAAALEELFHRGNGLEIKLNYYEDGQYYDGMRYAADDMTGRLCNDLSQYTWVAGSVDDTDCSSIEFTIPNSWENITFYDLGNGVLSINGVGESGVFVAETDGAGPSLFQILRGCYDNAEVGQLNTVTFSAENAQAAAERFAEEIYKEHLLGLTHGSLYAITDYDVVQWGTLQERDDGNAIVISLEYAIIPEDWNSSGIWAGNTRAGADEWEGWALVGREIGLEKSGSMWHCYSIGTGGVQLP